MRIQETHKILKEARSTEHLHEAAPISWTERAMEWLPSMRTVAGVASLLSAAAIGLVAVKARPRRRFLF